MIQHSPVAFSHDQFLMVMQKVANTELYYRAISFYIEEQPMQLGSLLKAIEGKLDHARVVQQLTGMGNLPLIMPYLKTVQTHNIQQVNEALNGLYIEAEDHESLGTSIDAYDNIDQIGLAGQLETHELLEFRRVAAKLYTLNKRYKQSIELSKKDKIYKDAMVTAKDSGAADLAESLLAFFIESKDKECFTAMLFTCYDLLKPDVVLELAWRNDMMDAAMPYVIQSVKQYSHKIDSLDVKEQKKEQAEEKSKSAVNDFVPDMPMGGGECDCCFYLHFA